MRKYLRYFNTEADYNSAKSSDPFTTNQTLSYIDYENKLIYGRPTVAGDIAYVPTGGGIRFCSYSNWDSSLGEAIGIVVIPSSHRSDNSTVILYTNYKYEAFTSKNYYSKSCFLYPNAVSNTICKVISVDPTTSGELTSYSIFSGLNDNKIYFPTEYNFRKQSNNRADNKSAYPNISISSYYYNTDSDVIYFPSPYKKNGLKNPIYYYPTNKYSYIDYGARSGMESVQDFFSLSTSERKNYPWYYDVSYGNIGRLSYPYLLTDYCYIPTLFEMGYLMVRWSTIYRSLCKITSGHNYNYNEDSPGLLEKGKTYITSDNYDVSLVYMFTVSMGKDDIAYAQVSGDSAYCLFFLGIGLPSIDD